jgi:hypothetical protein
VLKESFHQLGKLQQECNDELSTFQRENFIAHEEFRSVSAGLFQAVNDFQTKINAELDKLTLRINQLEIIAMNAFDVAGRRVLSCPNARFMVCANERIRLHVRLCLPLTQTMLCRALRMPVFHSSPPMSNYCAWSHPRQSGVYLTATRC